MLNTPTRLRHAAIGWTIAALIGLVVGFSMARSETDAEVRKSIQIWSAAFEEVVNTYVDSVSPSDLMETGMQAMLSDLDPYTTYISPDDRATVDVLTRGRYIGLGIQVDRRGQYVAVTSVVEGSSADHRAISIGDIITHIDGEEIASWSLNQVRAALRGTQGSTVELSLLRLGETPATLTLRREPVELATVPYSGFIGGSRHGMGYVRVERFTHQAGLEVKQAIGDLQRRASLNGLVLDLRDNPGGLLNAAVDVSSLFLDRGRVVVSTKGRDGLDRSYRNTNRPLYGDVPLVLLVNGRSASATEIVAGAIQDHDRGIVLGQTTFGKGLVQVIRSLPHGGSLKMTTARYYTPSGRSIQSAPDIADARPPASRQIFETTTGRPVQESQGIRPDVPIDDTFSSPLERALLQEGAFFRFASHVARTYERPPRNGWERDSLIASFRDWIEAEGISYQTQTQDAASRIDSLVTTDHPDASDALSNLQSTLQRSVDRQFEAHSDILMARLLSEIRTRYLTERGYYASSLAEDEMVREAVSLLNDERRYVTVLNP